MDEIPNCPAVQYCHCYPDEEQKAKARGETHCVCGDTEKALRAWMSGRITQPMTKKQREWCLNEIENVEGYNRKDHEGDGESDLARTVLFAWQDYCRDKGLL